MFRLRRWVVLPLLVAFSLGVLLAQERKAPATDARLQDVNADRVEEFEYSIEGVKKQGKRRVLTFDLGGGEKLHSVRISKGTFKMGAPDGEKVALDNEKPQHSVELTSDFYMGQFEVTQGQYEQLMGENPSRFKGKNLPVENVPLRDESAKSDITRFLAALNRKTGKKFTLPTEAQWEYACRAGTTTPFHFGKTLNGSEANCDGNFPNGTDTKGPSLDKTCEVGKYLANPWGLHDMHGNVWE